MTNREKALETYEEIFDSEKAKAEAFDRLAKEYYAVNFGCLAKADLDVLMFSLYLDQILGKESDNENAYSDYTLSKLLGITQAKVANLKVKKQLQYPYEKFNWRNAFIKATQNAICENGKIKMQIRDKNVFLEVKNAIEIRGGFVDIQLTSGLLQVNTQYFLDLVLILAEENLEPKLRKGFITQLKEKLQLSDEVTEALQVEPLGKILLDQSIDFLIELAGNVIPGGTPLAKAVKNIVSAVRRSNQIKTKNNRG